MSDVRATSGAWLPARSVAAAATAKLAQIDASRRDAVDQEAERLAAAWWRPFIRNKADGQAECRRIRFARYWYSDGEHTAYNLGTLAGMIGDELMFVTADDFRSIANYTCMRPHPMADRRRTASPGNLGRTRRYSGLDKTRPVAENRGRRPDPGKSVPMTATDIAIPMLNDSLRAHLGHEMQMLFAPVLADRLPEAIQVLIARFEAALSASGGRIEAAFQDEMVRALPAMRGFAMSLTMNAVRADDLVQETLLKAWATERASCRGRTSSPGRSRSCATSSIPSSASASAKSRTSTARSPPASRPSPTRTTG